jgi:hypothetical protein
MIVNAAAAVGEPHVIREPQKNEVISVTIITGTDVHNHATLTMRLNGVDCTCESTGVATGPIDAMCAALQRFYPDLECDDYSSKSQGHHSNSVAKDWVNLRIGKETFSGDGYDRNTLVATAKAIASALDKLHWHRYKQAMKRR